MSTIADRVSELRARLVDRDLHGYVIPTSDPHLSEYVPPCWRRLERMTGFTGSAGVAIVGLSKAWLLTDSRYWGMAQAELDGGVIELVRLGAPDVPAFPEALAERFGRGDVVGLDPRTVSLADWRRWGAALAKIGARLEPVDENLVDAGWPDRPPQSSAPIEALSFRFSGEAPSAKVARVQEAVENEGADALVVTALDAIAWLLDLRGRDVDYNPVFVANAVVRTDRALLFVDEGKITDAVRSHLPDTVELLPAGGFSAALDELADEQECAWLDPSSCSAWVAERLTRGGSGATLREADSPIALMKARKNEVEIEGARACHVRDGVAMVRFLSWLEDAVDAGEPVSEIAAAARLAELRERGEHFQGLSFETISAFGSHAALPHYRPGAEGDRVIDGSSLYLVDSGGQYLDGTTDITRTTCFGRPTEEQVDRCTRVLRGHVRLARTTFPRGTTGKQLDVLAREALWDVGLDYGHGTGHGVGAYLNVHEGPQGIGPRARDVALEPGMILSNEPGFYLEGEYGVRIENLIVVEERPGHGAPGGQDFLGFETITLCPIDLRLVDADQLSPEERAWLDDYHRVVRERLSPHLEQAERAWLAKVTQPT